MKLKNRIKNYHQQLQEVIRLNSDNKINSSFFAVAPINDKNRCHFIEGFATTGNYMTGIYKMKNVFDETAIYLITAVLNEYKTNFIFAIQNE